MKLVRHGAAGQECPGLIDAEGLVIQGAGRKKLGRPITNAAQDVLAELPIG